MFLRLFPCQELAASMPWLRELRLPHNSLRGGLLAFLQALKPLRQLRLLDLRGNRLYGDFFAQVLKAGPPDSLIIEGLRVVDITVGLLGDVLFVLFCSWRLYSSTKPLAFLTAAARVLRLSHCTAP